MDYLEALRLGIAVFVGVLATSSVIVLLQDWFAPPALAIAREESDRQRMEIWLKMEEGHFVKGLVLLLTWAAFSFVRWKVSSGFGRLDLGAVAIAGAFLTVLASDTSQLLIRLVEILCGLATDGASYCSGA